MEGLLKFWLDTSLLTNFVCRDSVKLLVAFDGNYLDVVGIDRVVTSLSQQIESVLFQVSDKFTLLD